MALADDLEKLNAALPPAIAFFKQHPKLVAFVCAALTVAGRFYPDALKYRDAILAAPGLLDWLQGVAPKLEWAVKEFAPAPAGIVGG